MPKRTSFDSLYDRRKIGNLTAVNILSEVCNEEAKNIKAFTFLD